MLEGNKENSKNSKNSKNSEYRIRLIRKKSERPQDHLVLHQAETPFLSFPILDQEDWLTNAFSTRLGGVSTGDVSSLNLSFARDCSEENVKENFRRICAAAGFDPDRMVFSCQTHTVNIRRVREEDVGKGFSRKQDYSDIDGLITDCPGVTLVTFYADCVPLLAADPVHHVIGCAHSGWRGTAAGMGTELIRRMQEEFGTRPEDVIAAIGPSVCRECYEVSEDTAQQFRKVYAKEELQRMLFQKENGKYLLDLWEACRQNFLRAGVRDSRISIPDLCTCCNSQVLFSHRASKGRRGLLAAFLCIKKV